MNPSVGLFVIALASPAFAQIDSYGLRAKYGTPLNRETYDVQPGIRIVVDYGPSAQACRLEFFPVILDTTQAAGGITTNQQIDAVVAELVPPSPRGKDLGGEMMQVIGLSSLSSHEYEHVTISEPRSSGHRTSVIVSFKAEECRAQPVH